MNMPGQTYRVLLVEDDPGDAHLTLVAFREAVADALVEHVEDGVAALERLQDSDRPRPHLVLLDLNMPRMSGREFLAEIRRHDDLAAIPVVVLTTSDVQSDVLATYQLGAAGFITKPVDIQQFTEAIRQLAGYWFSLVRLPPG